MTAEHLMLIDPADLQTVRIECPACKTSVCVHLAPDGNVARLGSCPGCGRDVGSVADRKVADQLLQALRAWQQQGASFRLRFELSPTMHLGARPPQPAGPVKG